MDLTHLFFFETFVNDYHFVSSSLNGKYIVNAGGFVGDTALYFAGKGANVFSFEPDPNSFEIALKNIDLNPSLSKQDCNEKLGDRFGRLISLSGQRKR